MNTKLMKTAAAAAGVAGLVGVAGVAAPTATASPSGYHLPIEQSAIDGQSTWHSGVCHHGQGACGDTNHRWWANDLFQSWEPDPVFATRSGYVRSSSDSGCGVLVRYNSSAAASGTHGWLNCHGETNSRKVNVGDVVNAGQELMQMGATGTGSEHLHFEHRYMYGSSTNWSQDEDYQAYCTGAQIGYIRNGNTPPYVVAHRKLNGSETTYNSNCSWS